MRTRLPAFVCCLLLAACCLLMAAAPLRADIKLKLDSKAGDSISDVAKIVAHADSTDNIDKVEFYVDDQLRFTAPSVPYIFTWDTIPDKEGMHTLTVTAFDGNGQTKKLSITLNIENELALGGDALAQKAGEALKANDLPTAMKYCRRALKADPGNAEGSRVLAGIYATESDWNKAVTTLEKSKNVTTDSTTMLELATYKMRRALQPENTPTFFTELESIRSLRQQAADLHTAEVTKQNPDNTAATHEAIGDALLAAGHFHEAVLEYRKSADKEHAPATSVNRYALAKLYEGTPEEALEILHIAEVNGMKADAATRAVQGLALARATKYDEARMSVAGDVPANYPAALYVAAYADTSTGKYAQARAEAQAAAKLLPRAAETFYANSMTLQKINEQEDALNATLALAPFQVAPYLDFAARVAVEKQPDRYDRAMKFVDFVLKRDPGNRNARLQKALLYLQTNRLKEGGAVLDGLAQGTRQSPEVLEALSIYWQMSNKPGVSQRYNEAAHQMDKVRFDRPFSPTPMELMYDLNRKYRFHIGFFLTPTALYPPQTAALPAPAP
jgi:tetratricopeptide (TPR) repeat protein